MMKKASELKSKDNSADEPVKKRLQTISKLSLVLALFYIATGILSLKIASINDYTAVVFFPAGIALAACLSFPLAHVWPGILIGSFSLNLFLSNNSDWLDPAFYLLPTIIALASLLQAAIGSRIIRRFVSEPLTLSFDKDILRFLFSVPFICLISATVSVSTMELATSEGINFKTTWAGWWAGDALGILVFLPLVMSFIAEPHKLWRSRRGILTAHTLVFTLVIVILTSNIKQFEDNRIEDRFRIRTQEVGTLFQIALRAEELIQESVSQLFVSSDEVTRAEFSEFVRWSIDKNRYVQVVEWLPRITYNQRQAYEQQQRSYFGDSFSITEFVAKGQLGPAGKRDEYFPITYLEPEWDNKPARGFDPTSTPLSKLVIDKAIASGEATARPPLKILRDNNSVDALLIYRPIYQTAKGDLTLNPDRGEIFGLVNIVLRVKDFVDEILKQGELSDFTLKWQDDKTGEFYFNQPASNTSSLSHEVRFTLAGRSMRLVFNSTERFEQSASTKLAEFALIGGFLLSALFAMLILSISGRTHRISTEVSLRTEELSEAKNSAQESEKRIRDVLDEMQLTEQKLLLSDVAFNSASEAMMITDDFKKIIAINSAFTRITGYNSDEVIGEYPSFLIRDLPETDFQKLSDNFATAMKHEGIWRGEIQCRHKTNDMFPAYVSMSAVYDTSGNVSNMVGVFSDISAIKAAQAEIQRHANYDPLTDLPNRRLFTDRLQQSVLHCGRSREKLCLMFLDLDRFKDVNDTLGHEFGDELLKQMALRIKECVREVDTVARLGGDEFTIILNEFDNKSHAVSVAQKLITAIEKPITIKDQTLRITTSVGITFYPDDAIETGMLIQNADRAMYAAKEMGGSAFKFYTTELELSWLSRTFIMNELEAAIDKGEIEVHFQPLIAANTDSPCRSAEALVRWHHPERGVISPADFLPQAERMGMIEKIDDFVFSQVCRQIKAWQLKGLGDVHVSVNRSAHNFGNQRGRLDWLSCIREQGIDARLITLEITESVLMQRHAESGHLLKKLRQADIQIAVDDFGTGYSSLSYLKEMDIDYLKIDRSFIRDLEVDDDDRAIIVAITHMARHLGIEVVAEGVETASQKKMLEEIGCHWLQGYFFAKPMPASEFEQRFLMEKDAKEEKDKFNVSE
ncbi:EAL domain-containing protein [Methylophaga sp.]|uniref:EAL domain-containing protein n=1 Tax=Methylophaga sp. TaxID=2024840 RepID=UPI003F69CE6A